MVSQPPQPNLNGWQTLTGVSQEMLKPLRLKPGQALHDRDHLPPGVLLIEQGDMRLLGLDQRKEAFTLQRFSRGEIVGGELLLRGISGLALAAATPLKGSLLPAERFFQLLERHPEHLSQFCSLSPWELWAAAANRQDPNYPTAQELLRWAQQACELCSQPVRLLTPGSHELDLSDGSWLVSSDNCLLYTSPSPRDLSTSRMPSSA